MAIDSDSIPAILQLRYFFFFSISDCDRQRLCIHKIRTRGGRRPKKHSADRDRKTQAAWPHDRHGSKGLLHRGRGFIEIKCLKFIIPRRLRDCKQLGGYGKNLEPHILQRITRKIIPSIHR